MGGAEQRRLRIQYHPHLYLLEHRLESSLAGEPAHELPALKHRKNPGRYSAAYEDPAQREHLEREVAGLSPVHSAKHLEGVNANRIAPGKRRLGDGLGGVARRHRVGKPSRLGSIALRSQEPVDVHLARAGEDTFPAHVAEFALKES